MTQQQQASGISPVSVGLGALALSEIATELAAMLTFVYGLRPRVHLSLGPTSHNNIGLVERPPFDRFVGVGAGWTELVHTEIEIDPDVTTLVVGVRCVVAVGSQIRVRVIVGGVSVTITADDTNNGAEQTGTILTSSSGTGPQTLTVEVERTAGTGTAYWRNVRVQDQQITSSFPDPADD